MKSRAGSSQQRSAGEAPAPFWTIAQADLRGLFKSRITYAWLLAAAFIQILRTLSSASSGTTSSVVSSGLGDFVDIWSLVIIGLAASSVSSEAGELADSILSKSVTRLDYILAKFAARVAYTLVCFCLVTAVLVGLALRFEARDYSAVGLVSAISLVALMLVTLTALGVSFSVVLPNSVTAIVALLVLWFSMIILFPVVGLGVISPASILDDVPGIIKGTWSTTNWETVAGLVAISGVSTALSSAYFHMKDI